MNDFVQQYTSGTSLRFVSIPEGSFQSKDTQVVVSGSTDQNAWFGQFDQNGIPMWQKVYRLDGQVLSIYSSLQCDNGNFLLYGNSKDVSLTGGDQVKERQILLRVDNKGAIIWAKSYSDILPHQPIGIIKSEDDTYIFRGRVKEQNSTVDHTALIRIDGTGNIMYGVRVIAEQNNYGIGIIPWKNGSIIYGNCNDGSGHCFVTGFDSTLQLLFSNLLVSREPSTLSAMLEVEPDKFVITGETGKARNSYIAELNLRGRNITGHVYDFKAGPEVGFKILRRGPGGHFYLLSEMPIEGRLNFVARFDEKYHLKWIRRFQLKADHYIYDLHYNGENDKGKLLISGSCVLTANKTIGLLACTDAQMNSCVTKDLPVPRPVTIEFLLKKQDLKTTDNRLTINELKPEVQNLKLQPDAMCKGGPQLDTRNALVQSPYIYLQTAGSTQADDSVPGYHIRWEFMRSLGDQHLPKGNLAAPGGPYPTNIAFNRPDDFVRIYKNDFTPEFGIEIDFVKPPSIVIETGPTRQWIYNGLQSSSGFTTSAVLRFTNRVLYNFIRQSVNPLSHPAQFLSHYTDIFELRLSGKLFFYMVITTRATSAMGNGKIRLETISLNDRLDPTTRHISSRNIYDTGTVKGLIGENWEYIRFDLENAVPIKFYLIPYEDYITGTNARNGWTFWNDYSLDDGSDGNQEVFKRLEDPGTIIIDRIWRKFNEPTIDEFRVNTENYRKRWRMPDGLQEGVKTYLEKSRIDPLANVQLISQDPDDNNSITEISYLTMLNFVGLDFHVGRMLGFGAIDPATSSNQDGTKRVYLMQYYTSASLENGQPPRLVSHLYLAPPISAAEHRLPLSPSLLPVVYGLSADACGGTTTLTDAEGYAPYADIRFINLHRRPFLYEKPFEPFFQSSIHFDLFRHTHTVLFGIEYGPGNAGSGNWVRPEISHDADWLDHADLPEVRAVPDSGENPVYTHGETQPGIHHYAAYSINWFSRISPLSNEVQTDLTVFDPRNTLLPPSQFAVQLVQKETPPILTSTDEQTMLASMGQGDTTLVRATFNWNQVHNNAFQYADKAQLFFRVQPPLVVRGKITAVTENNLTHTALLTTASYIQSSQPTTVQPFVAAADAAKFIGSTLVVEGETFIVDAIVSTGNNPQIQVRQIRQTASMDSQLQNEYCTVENFISPGTNKFFLMVENLNLPANWDTQLNKEVTLTQFLPVHTEDVTHADGQITTHVIGGLTGAAIISHIYDPDPDLGSFIPSGGPSATEVPTGVYTVAYSSALLPPHPEPDVSYYQGTVRLRSEAGEIRVLQVWNIDLSGPNPVLTVYDPTFSLQRDPDGMFIITAGEFTLTSGVDSIRIGNVPFANFHPGYRVYLYADLDAGHNFGAQAMLPVLNEGTKQTFMAIRSKDVDLGLTSYMSTPVILLAREIRDPVPPGTPLASVYATRPNFYGKATFTFDVQVDQPYSLIFYKANERKLLDQLYHPEKVVEIFEALRNLSDDDAAYSQNRWNDLANGITDESGQFKEYIDGGFRFPPPTNPDYVIPDPSLASPVKPFHHGNVVAPGSNTLVPGTSLSWKVVVRQAIEGAFVPLTELPAVYSQLNHSSIQTSGKPPKVRDSNGKRIQPSDPNYDPWPMITRFERNAQDHALVHGNAGYGDPVNRRFVRFTDYNLDGAATNTYFYFSKELSSTLVMSDKSPVVGPVKLVNAAPAEAPGIGRVVTLVKNSELGTSNGVRFELNEYLPIEGIARIQLYRAIDPDDALSIRTMQLVKTVDAGTDLNDTFDDMTYVPFATPLFYRIVALRSIQNERGEIELIPSKPSNLVLASLIDNANPQPPALAFSSDPPIGSPIQLHNVILSWSPTCYNGKYLLYKRSSGGHWIKIAETAGNNAVFYQPLASTDLASGTLPKQNDDLDYLFHQFKVVAINSSGLLSRVESVLRI